MEWTGGKAFRSLGPEAINLPEHGVMKPAQTLSGLARHSISAVGRGLYNPHLPSSLSGPHYCYLRRFRQRD